MIVAPQQWRPRFCGWRNELGNLAAASTGSALHTSSRPLAHSPVIGALGMYAATTGDVDEASTLSRRSLLSEGGGID